MRPLTAPVKPPTTVPVKAPVTARPRPSPAMAGPATTVAIPPTAANTMVCTAGFLAACLTKSIRLCLALGSCTCAICSCAFCSNPSTGPASAGGKLCTSLSLFCANNLLASSLTPDAPFLARSTAPAPTAPAASAPLPNMLRLSPPAVAIFSADPNAFCTCWAVISASISVLMLLRLAINGRVKFSRTFCMWPTVVGSMPAIRREYILVSYSFCSRIMLGFITDLYFFWRLL